MSLDFQKILAFVKVRHKASGGYGATPLLPATVEDTYHAVKTLFLLKRLFPRLQSNTLLTREDIQFLKTKWEEGELGLKSGYQVLSLLFHTDLKPSKQSVQRWLLRCSTRLHRLEAFYFWDQILRKFGLGWTLFQKERLPDLPPEPTVKEVYFRLYLQIEIMGKFPKREKEHWASWLKECQNGDGGFGFRPGTTSFVENTHYALRSLNLLRTKPRHLEEVQNFLSASQKPEGGFSRRPGAAPFLDATWHAVSALSLLKNFLG